jgi:hypothetical protein
MRRHHYLYARTRWLTDPGILAGLRDTHRRLAVEQARSLGLLDPEGPGSWTHPDLSGTVALIDRVRERGGPVGSSDQITLVNSSNAAASRRCSWRASKSSS